MSKEQKELKIQISHLFSDSDWRSINVFQRRAEDMFKVRLLSSPSRKISAKIDLNKNSGLSLNVILPEEDFLKEFFMAFRFFYLEKEPSNFNKIANIIANAAKNQGVNDFVRHIKKIWSGALTRENVFFVTLNREVITPKRLLDVWFNAHYFHSEQEKEEDLKALNRMLSTDLSKFLLVDSVYEAINAASMLYESIATLKKP